MKKNSNSVWFSFKSEMERQGDKGLPLMEMNYAVSKSYPKLMKIFKEAPAWKIPYFVQAIERMEKENNYGKEMLYVEKIDADLQK